MLKRILAIAFLLAALAACERTPEPARVTIPEAKPAVGESKAVSAAPEHFDRVRAERLEKEEEGLRRRARQ